MSIISDYLSSSANTYSDDVLEVYKARTLREERQQREYEEMLKEREHLNNEMATVRREIGLDKQDSFVEAVKNQWSSSGAPITYNGETGLYEVRKPNTAEQVANDIPFVGAFRSLYESGTERKAKESGAYDPILKTLENNKTEYINRIGAENYNQLYQEVLGKTTRQGLPQSFYDEARKNGISNSLSSDLALRAYDEGNSYRQDINLGDLQVKRNSAWDKYYMSGLAADKQVAEGYDEALARFGFSNPDAGKQTFSGTANYIPQAIYYAKKNLPATALALAASAAGYYLGAPEIGNAAAKGIYSLGTIASGFEGTMEQTRGGEFGDMVKLGIPESIAKKAANESAFWQSLIEEVETAKDLFNAFKVPQQASTMNAFKKFFKNWGVNIITEGLEEGSQSVVGYLYQWDAMQRGGVDTSDMSFGNMVEQAWEEAKGGAEIGLTMYFAEGVPHIIMSDITNRNTQKQIIADAPIGAALYKIEQKVNFDEYGNAKDVPQDFIKRELNQAYGKEIARLKSAQRLALTEGEKADIQKVIDVTEKGRQKVTSDKGIASITKEINKGLDTQVVNKEQKLNKTTKTYATKVLKDVQETERANTQFKNIEFSVANRLTAGQKFAQQLMKSAGVDVVFYNVKNYREGTSTYSHRGFIPDPNNKTIFINAGIRNTKNVMAVIGHEYAHHYVKVADNAQKIFDMYTNEEAKRYAQRKGLWTKQGFPSLAQYQAWKEEMFADDVGEYLSTEEAVNGIRNGDQSIMKAIQDKLTTFVENETGYTPRFNDVTQFNLNGQSVLKGNNLNQDITKGVMENIKKEQQENSGKKKLSKKETTKTEVSKTETKSASRLTSQQKENYTWYKEQKEDNVGRDKIQKSLATRMKKGVNSQEVKDELARLEKKYNQENSIKRSAEITTKNWYDEEIMDKNNKFINLADYKDEIENSMSMKQAEEMIIKADRYRLGSLKSGNKTIRDILNKKPSELIAKEILSSGLLIQKFIEPVKVLREQPDLVEGVVLAYKANALKGNIEKRKFGKINKKKDVVSEYVNPNFYRTGLGVDDKKIIDEAFRTDKNAEYDNKVREARKEFIIRAHNPEWLAKNNIDAEAAYTSIINWSTLSDKELKLIESLNKGVSYYNRWTGIENSSIIKIGDYSAWDLTERLGISTSEKWHDALTKYIISTVLALDTQENWSGLMVDLIDGYRPRGITNAEYSIDNDEITIFKEGQNTVSHEMGHRLDAKWASELLGRRYGHGWSSSSPNKQYSYLTDRLTEESLENLVPTSSARNFIKHFYAFLDDISQSSDLSSGYTADETEVFARFFAKFIAWTFEKANNNVLEAEADVYDDVFSERQFRSFVKLLQEKSAVDQEFFEFYKSDDWKKYSTLKRELGDFKFEGKESIAYLAIKAFQRTGRDESKFFDYILKNKEDIATTKYEKELYANITNNPYTKTAFKQIFDGLKEIDSRYELNESGSKEGKLVSDAFNKSVYNWQGYEKIYTLSQDAKRSAEIEEDSKGKKLSEGQIVWNRGNKFVDNENRVKRLYHGTTVEGVYVFDKNKLSPWSDWGKGIYLSDDEGDVDLNYVGGGPDYEVKVSRLAEALADNSEYSDLSEEELEEKAREILGTGSDKKTVYAKALNPAIVGKTRLFEYSADDVDVYREDYSSDDEYEDAIIYAIYDKVDEAIDEAALFVDNEIGDSVDFGDYKTVKSVISQVIAENVIEPGEGIEVDKFKDAISDELLDAGKYNDLGEWEEYANEIARLVIQSQGYDGIIDNTVSKKFKNMHLGEGTTHYIVFNSEQVKDVNNLNPTTNPDIRLSAEVTDDTISKQKWNGRASDVRNRLIRYANNLKLKDGYKINVDGSRNNGKKIVVSLRKDTYDDMVVDEDGNKVSKTQTVKEFEASTSDFKDKESFVKSVKDKIQREFKDYIKQSRLQRTQDELREEKAENRGRKKAIRWTWKKEEQQKKQSNRWKAKAEKGERTILGMRARAQENRRVKALNAARRELINKIKTFEKSKAFKFMTDEQKKQYEETFGNIYKGGISKKARTRQLELIKANIASQLIDDPNVVVSTKVKNMVKAPEKITLDAVETIEQVNELLDAYKKIVEQVQKQQQLVGLKRNEDALEQQEEFAEAVRELEEKHDDKRDALKAKQDARDESPIGKIINKLQEGATKVGETLSGFFETALSTIETELLRIAEGNRKSKIMKIYENLNEGVTRERAVITNLRGILNKYLTEKEYRELRKSLNPKSDWVDTGVEVTDTRGRKHKLVLDHGRLMALAMHSMQEQSLKHIGGAITDIWFDEDGDPDLKNVKGGGLTIPDMKYAKRGDLKRAVAEGYTVVLSPAEINDIVGKSTDANGDVTFENLTAEENEFIKAMQEFFKQTREYTNEVYRILHGFDMPTIENYFPIVANKAWIFRDTPENLTYKQAAKAYGMFDKEGFVQERKNDAYNPIVLESVADVLTRMTNGVAKYYGYNIALHNNEILLSTKDDSFSVENALNKIAPNFKNDYETLTGFISGTKAQPYDIVARFRGRHAEFTLGLNPSSWVKQLLSVPTTIKYFTAKELAGFVGGGEKALYDAMKSYLEMTGEYEKGKVLQNFTGHLTNDLAYRNELFGLVDMSDAIDNKSLFERMDILKGIARFDKLGVTTVTRMFLYAELARRNLLGDELTRISAEEADRIFQDIGYELERFLRQTQPDYSQTYRANITRNTGPFARFITMYSTPTLQMTNNMLQSAYELNYAIRNGEDVGAAWNKMIKSALGVFLASLGSVLISRAVSKLLKGGDDDDEDYDFGKELVVSMLAPTLVLDDLARGFLGMNTYESQTPELIAIDALIEIGSSLNEIWTGEPQNAYNKWKKIVTNAGLLFGIPARDIYKLGKAVLMYAQSDLYWQMSLRENPNAYKKFIETEGSIDTKDFYKAYTATREKVLETKYGYHKADKSKNIKSNKKEAFRKALVDVFNNDTKKVNQYMTILGGYKS